MIQERDPELRKLSQVVFMCANVAAIAAFVAEAAALVLGGFFTYVDAPLATSTTPMVLLALAVVFLRGTAESWKEHANAQLRALDLANGFGQRIDPDERRDLLASAPWLPAFIARGASHPAPYFASERHGSPARLVEIIRESAWWTGQLSGSAERWQKRWVGAFVFVAGWTLLQQALTSGGFLSGAFFASPAFVVGLLLFLITSGPGRRIAEYRAFGDAARQVCGEAARLLDSRTEVTEGKAAKLAADYHLARKGAPLLPTLLWKIRQKELDRLWREHLQALPDG